MEQQLTLLIQLQEMDLKIRALTEKQKRFSDIVASFDRRRSQNKEELDKTRENLQIAQKTKRERDKDLEVGAEKVEKLKARSSEIKTNKEYQASLKEVESAEKENKSIEDEILVLMEKIDAAATLITEAEKRAGEEEAAIAAEQKEQEEAFAGDEIALKAVVQQRQEAAAAIEKQILAHYQKIMNARGTAVAEARGEACSGCYMSIPPQVFVNVKKNENVINCPNCGRILFFKG